MTIDELLVSVGFKFTGQAGLESFRQAIADLEKDLQPLAASLNQAVDYMELFASQAAATAQATAAVTQEATAQAAALDQVATALETAADQSGFFAGQTIVASDAAAAAVAGVTAHQAALAQAAIAATQAAAGATAYATQTAQAGSAAAAATAQVKALTAAQGASGGTPTAPNAPTPPPAKDPTKKANAELKEKFGRVKEIAKELAKYTAVAYGAAAAVAAFVLKLSKTNDELSLASQNLKISASELSAWSGAAKIVLGASADMIESLEKLQMTAVNARMEGGQAAAAFASLGVQTHDFTGNLKGSNEIMMGIVDGLDRLPDRQMKLWRLNQLGLANMLPFFEKGRAAIEEMMQEQKEFGPTPDQLSQTREFMMLFQRFGLYVRYLANIFTEELQPVLGDIMRDFIEWVRLNREVIKTKIQEFAYALAVALRLLVTITSTLLDMFLGLSSVLGGVHNAILLIVAAIGLALTAFFPLTAAITFLVLSFINLWRVLTGQESAWDVFAGAFPRVAAGIRLLLSPLTHITAMLLEFFELLSNPFDSKQWAKTRDAMGAILGDIGDNWDIMTGPEIIKAAGQAAAINPSQLGAAAVQNAQTSSAAGLILAQQNTNTSRNLSKMEVAVNVTGDARGLDVAQLGKILSERLSFEVEQATLNLNSGVTA